MILAWASPFNMYTQQTMTVQWGNVTSNAFKTSKSVKQGSVLSPILFTLYIDVLLSRLESCGFGYYIGQSYVAVLGYADDIALLAPTRYLLSILLKDLFSEGYLLTFNTNESNYVVFPHVCENVSTNIIFMNNEIASSDSSIHLGNVIGPHSSIHLGNVIGPHSSIHLGNVIGPHSSIHLGNVIGPHSSIHLGNVIGPHSSIHLGNVVGPHSSIHLGNVIGPHSSIHLGNVVGPHSSIHLGNVIGPHSSIHLGNVIGSHSSIHLGNVVGPHSSIHLGNVIGSHITTKRVEFNIANFNRKTNVLLYSFYNVEFLICLIVPTHVYCTS